MSSLIPLCRRHPLRALLSLAALVLSVLILPNASAQGTNPVPAISGLSPSSAVAWGPSVKLTVSGTGFASDSAVYWNGQFLRPTLVTDPNLPPKLVVTVSGLMMIDVGAFPVTVINPAPGGGTSNTVTFRVIAPVPAISGLNPSGAEAGSKSVRLTVYGDGLVSSSVIEWNGHPLPTEFISTEQTRLVTYLGEAQLAAVGTGTVTVVSPAPGGGTSNAQSFPIIPPIPTPVLTALSPSHVTEGGPDFLLTVTGTGFDSTSRIHISVYPYSLQGLPTTLVSPTQLTATIPAATISSHFSQAIQVVNGVGGINYVPSNSLTLTVDTPPYPVPTLTALSPGSVPAGSGGFLLQLAGTGFNRDMTVTFGGARLSGSLVTAGMNVFIPDADVPAAAGAVPITVTSPSSGPGFGGTSNALTFTFTAPLNPLPVVTGLSPASAVQGDPDLTVTVKGSSLLPISQVNWNGVPLATTFVSATQMTAVVPAALLANYGTATVSVSTPAPGGGTAAYSPPFLVTPHPNPVPTISALTPDHCTSDGGGLVHITGTNIVPGASATVNGAQSRAVAGTVTATGFDIVLGLSDVQTPGTLQVAVVNPPNAGDGPPGSGAGGGKSGALPFTVTPPANPVPSIAQFAPVSVPAGGGGFSLRVYGQNFVRGATVTFGKDQGLVPSADTMNDGTLDVLIPAADIAQMGDVPVTVTNPPAGGGGGGGGNSAALLFPITAALSPVPTLSALSPNPAPANGSAITLTVTGTNFVPASQVRWSGTALVTTFVSATRLTAAVPAALLAATSGVPISVYTPAPGGGFAGDLPLAVVRVSQTHLLWTNAGGQASLWAYDTAAGAFTQTTYGPFPGWTAKAIADGPDGETRVLWTAAAGQASLWDLDGASGLYAHFEFRPYPGWTATQVSVGPDNVTHLLWTSSDGRLSLWDCDAASGAFTQGTYGPFSGWSARAIADGGYNKARVLWDNSDGRMSLWELDTPTGVYAHHEFGPYPGWSAVALSAPLSTGAGTVTHVAWTNGDGRLSLWNADAAGGAFTQNTYGPFAGWSARATADGADGRTRVLWGSAGGAVSLWSLDNASGLYTHYEFGPYPGWAAVALSAGP